MDDFIKLLKFGLNNRAAIFSVWVMILSSIGLGGYMYESGGPVKPKPEQSSVKTEPHTHPLIEHEHVFKDHEHQLIEHSHPSHKQISDNNRREHEKQYHFVD